MLRAVLEDCCQLPGLVVRYAWGDRSPPPATPPNASPVSLTSDRDSGGDFEKWVRQTDAALLIAPELDDRLGTLTARAEACGASLLGPSAATIRAAADKLELPVRLAACGVPALPAVRLDGGGAWVTHFPTADFPTRPVETGWVAKPRYGAGATAVEFVTDPSLAPRPHHRELIVTPYVEGKAVSVAVLVGPQQALPLAPCTQQIRGGTPQRPEFSYHGGRLPLPAADVERAQDLALRAVASFPQLRGFVGVDLILATRSADDVVVEINPRLTSSYLGLRAFTSANLSGLWLDIMAKRTTPAPTWLPGNVEFSADGRVEVLERC